MLQRSEQINKILQKKGEMYWEIGKQCGIMTLIREKTSHILSGGTYVDRTDLPGDRVTAGSDADRPCNGSGTGAGRFFLTE